MNTDPEVRAAMKCRITLRKNLIDFIKNVRPDTISDYLYQEGHLTTDQLRSLTDDHVDELKRTRQLFDTLYNMHHGRLPAAFQHFIDALRRDVDWLVVQIEFTNVTEAEIDTELQQFQQIYQLPNDPPQQANDMLTQTYTASVLMYRFVRNMLTKYVTSPSQADEAGASSRACELDAATIRNTTFEPIVKEFHDDARAVGVGERQAAVDVRLIGRKLAQYADNFERIHGHQIDRLVEKAAAGGLDAGMQWFTQLVELMFKGGINWGRIVSLFVFSSRFVLRLAIKGLSSLVRLMGTAVFGFTKAIVNKASSWMSAIGGWEKIDNNEAASLPPATIPNENETNAEEAQQVQPIQGLAEEVNDMRLQDVD